MLRIFASDQDGDEFEVTDLYWFEEEGVHNFHGKGFHENYTFRFEMPHVESNFEAALRAEIAASQERERVLTEAIRRAVNIIDWKSPRALHDDEREALNGLRAALAASTPAEAGQCERSPEN